MPRRSLFLVALLFLSGLILGSSRIAEAADTSPLRYEASWKATLPDASHGYGVALMPSPAPTVADWVAPNVPGALAVGFDAYDPPTKNPFNAERNIEGRPEQEVALYWNGIEIARRLSPVAFKGSGGASVKLTVEYVVGGADVSVKVGKANVYDHYFVPQATPCAAQIASGGDAKIDGLKLSTRGTVQTPTAPIHVRAFDQQLNDNDHHRATTETDFPANVDNIGRVVCTLTLDKTPAGLDKWDRIANIYLYDENGERFEILRYITPYNKAYQWKADVTDLLPLLTGHKKMEMSCETYGPGWLVSVDFDFYPGPLKQRPYKVVNLWNTIATIGEADKPLSQSIPDKTIAIDPQARHVAVRMCVTGHGQAPNTDDAAEFIPLWRKLTVSDHTYENLLWKTDNYLNPCRPQGGTWKYDRAGWGPGTVVIPWLVDITRNVQPGQDATFHYEIQPYVNKTPDKGNPARHIIESQVIFYKDSK